MVANYLKESIMARMTRKDLLNSPDEFVTTTTNTITWIKENPMRFTVSAIVVVCIVAGGYGFYFWNKYRTSESIRAYMKAEENSQMTLKVAQDYEGTMSGKLGKLRLARMSFDQGNFKMAINYAEDFSNNWGKKDIFLWESSLLTSAAYMKQNQVAKALPLLEECIKNAPKDIKDQALFLKASALISMNKPGEAKEALKSVSDSYREIAKSMLASQASASGEMNAK
jgi:tetratricopeptide (TPR) repeat protein